MKITVLGNGGFGTALAMVAAEAGHECWQWGHSVAYTEEMAETRRNPRYLPGIAIPDSIRITADGAAALSGADAVLMAVPTQHVRATMSGLASAMPADAPVISLAKGLEQETSDRPSEVLEQVLTPGTPILVLGGPSHAEEVARSLPTTVVLAGAGAGAAFAERIQSALSTSNFRIYTNTDMLGVELCGALKNVMAVAAGMAQGYGLGDNAKAAILSRGIVEMSRYGRAEGAEPRTFFGLAGMGDLAVTAFSQHGRNRAFGERIGKGESLDSILESTHKVAEGVWTSRVVCRRAAELEVEMPICDAVASVLFDGVPMGDALSALMHRDSKDEVLS